MREELVPGSAFPDCNLPDLSTDDHQTAGIPRFSRGPVNLPFGSGPNGSKGPRRRGMHRPRAQPDDSAHARAQAETRYS